MDYNRSLFISSQLPDYIRTTYPLFVSFLEQYYSYLDRSVGQLIAVVVDNPGSNYSSNPTLSIQVIQNNEDYYNYGEQIQDYKGAVLVPVVNNGRITKVLVTNYGQNYNDADDIQIVVTDPTGSGAVLRPVVVENLGNINEASKSVISVRDIDQEFDLITAYLENEYIPNFPKNLYTSEQVSVEAKAFIKFIKQFYGKKGTEDSIKFLYRILFNVDVNFYYPSTDMLRVSDGKWEQNKWLSLTGASGVNVQSYVGHRIIGNTSNATAIVQYYTQPTGSYYLLNLSDVTTGFSETPEDIYDYDITGKGIKIGTSYNTGATGILYSSTGSYIGTDGQLSSNKKIQDSYYYQQFSYELRSSENIRNFKSILEELVHPAGLKYFILLTLEAAAKESVKPNSETNINPGPDIALVSSSSPSSKALGPTYRTIEVGKSAGIPSFYIDFTGTGAVGATGATTTLTLGNSITYPNFESSASDLYGFTAIITPTSGSTGVQTKTIVNWDPVAKNATLDSLAYFSSSTSYTYRVIQNYRPTFVDNTNGYFIGATGYDRLEDYGFTNFAVTTLAGNITNSTNPIPVVCQSDNYYNTNDIIAVGSEKMLILGATGTLAGATSFLGVTRGYYGTTAGATGAGTTVYDYSRHLFRNYKLYVTTGPGAGQSTTIIGWDGASGIIKYSPTFATAPNSNSTYFIYPDLYNNSGYFTTYVQNIVLKNGGTGYNTGATGVVVTIDPPLAGVQATAYATVTGGVITGLTLGATGSGYITTPKVTITDPAGKNAEAYVDLFPNVTSPFSEYLNYSPDAGVILQVTDAANKFAPAYAKAAITNGAVTSVTVLNGGTGYVQTPNVNFIGGGVTIPITIGATGTFAAATASLLNGSVNGVTINYLGSNYVDSPLVSFDNPGFRRGLKVYQANTGARGTIDNWDAANYLLYIYKDPTSPEFDSTPISYYGININVDLIQGVYNTLGKRVKSIQESEISITKV